MKRFEWLTKKTILKNCKSSGFDTHIDIGGIFDTEKVSWKYYVISWYTDNGRTKSSPDIGGKNMDLTISYVETYSKEFKTKDECIEFIENYITKWETKSNYTIEEKRDKKLSQLLDEK